MQIPTAAFHKPEEGWRIAFVHLFEFHGNLFHKSLEFFRMQTTRKSEDLCLLQEENTDPNYESWPRVLKITFS